MTDLILPTTAGELLTFKLGYEVRGEHGTYHVFTGYEEGGRICWWCGGELHGKQRRWCREGYGTDDAHWLQYWRHFNWGFARAWCFDRYGHRCANCGAAAGFEAHHIIPLNGEERAWSIFNLPWNLIAFCHECHQEIHAVMRGASRLPPPDIFKMAFERGQLVFDALR